MWEWVLAGWSLVTMILAGKKKRFAWVWGLAGQGLWAVYAITNHKYGFLLAAIPFSVVYIRNWVKWKEGECPDTPS
jgi:hypothetical protein